MGKTLKIGRVIFDVKSLLVGMAVVFAGLSLSPTQTFFSKVLSFFNSTLGSIFKKK